MKSGLDLNKFPQGSDRAGGLRSIVKDVWTLMLVPGATGLSTCVQSVASQVTSRWCSDNREKKAFVSEAEKGVFNGFKTGFQSSDQLPIFHTSICGSSREQ